MDIFFRMRPPVRFLVGEGILNDPEITNGLHDGPIPWFALSDLLIADQREFVGIVLYAGEEDAATAKDFAASVDPRTARYYSPAEAARIPRYKTDMHNFSVLEFLWSPIEPKETEVAQLLDEWYYYTVQSDSEKFPAAYGYSNIDAILQSYNIKLPCNVLSTLGN